MIDFSEKNKKLSTETLSLREEQKLISEIEKLEKLKAFAE